MLYITRPAWQMLMLAAKHQDLEVGGFGRVHLDESGRQFVLEDILIPPQEVMGAHTDIAGEHLDWLITRIIELGDQPKDWPLWWHSHVNMSTHPSSQDTETLEALAEQSQDRYAPWPCSQRQG